MAVEENELEGRGGVRDRNGEKMYWIKMSYVLVVLIEHGFHNRPESFLPLEHGFLRHYIRHYIAFEASTEEVVG